jgi:hypothetical protein
VSTPRSINVSLSGLGLLVTISFSPLMLYRYVVVVTCYIDGSVPGGVRRRNSEFRASPAQP